MTEQTKNFTQQGPEGVFFDFNDGARISVPEGENWRVQIKDAQTVSILFDTTIAGPAVVQSSKRYYVPFEITVWKEDKEVLKHLCRLEDEEVLIEFNVGGVGDHLAWMGQAQEFIKKHKCKATFLVKPDIAPLFENVISGTKVISAKEAAEKKDYYATYRMCIFFDDKERNYQPTDYRQSGLARMGADILGLSSEKRIPQINIAPGDAPIKEPYVCIAVQASGLSKYWNHYSGWVNVVAFLKEKGYRVICIDLQKIGGTETVPRMIPHGCEDMTGKHCLTERARWLKHAAFFIGVSSGLSWLAWAAGAKIVMISGYTDPENEFDTPWRVINRNVCNSCANDVNIRFYPNDSYFCPRYKGTDRVFECSKAISPIHVIREIGYLMETLPKSQRPKSKEKSSAKQKVENNG